jgi:hypothetical protein
MFLVLNFFKSLMNSAFSRGKATLHTKIHKIYYLIRILQVFKPVRLSAPIGDGIDQGVGQELNFEVGPVVIVAQHRAQVSPVFFAYCCHWIYAFTHLNENYLNFGMQF